ncbi:hypothetical protein KVT40_008353 [Elsinoe batatas]|uniref:Uncharacterized protein n=1 Tax=Elsinoe batatas TaxID=2601811 RepID=A0A8K0KUD2_9PEZI|nr:hypothetical protein KVT40_008353 [Elsinoe batatas]
MALVPYPRRFGLTLAMKDQNILRLCSTSCLHPTEAACRRPVVVERTGVGTWYWTSPKLIVGDDRSSFVLSGPFLQLNLLAALSTNANLAFHSSSEHSDPLPGWSTQSPLATTRFSSRARPQSIGLSLIPPLHLRPPTISHNPPLHLRTHHIPILLLLHPRPLPTQPPALKNLIPLQPLPNIQIRHRPPHILHRRIHPPLLPLRLPLHLHHSLRLPLPLRRLRLRPPHPPLLSSSQPPPPPLIPPPLLLLPRRLPPRLPLRLLPRFRHRDLRHVPVPRPLFHDLQLFLRSQGTVPLPPRLRPFEVANPGFLACGELSLQAQQAHFVIVLRFEAECLLRGGGDEGSKFSDRKAVEVGVADVDDLGVAVGVVVGDGLFVGGEHVGVVLDFEAIAGGEEGEGGVDVGGCGGHGWCVSWSKEVEGM